MLPFVLESCFFRSLLTKYRPFPSLLPLLSAPTTSVYHKYLIKSTKGTTQLVKMRMNVSNEQFSGEFFLICSPCTAPSRGPTFASSLSNITTFHVSPKLREMANELGFYTFFNHPILNSLSARISGRTSCKISLEKHMRSFWS